MFFNKELAECLLVAASIAEGRDTRVIDKIARQVESVHGILMLDVEPHAKFNRTVITYGGKKDDVFEASLKLAEATYQSIDLSKFQGEKPALGALEFVPFIPLSSVQIPLANEVAIHYGEEIASRYKIPVFLYGASAAGDGKKILKKLKGQGLEQLNENLKSGKLNPHFGPPVLHPDRGICMVGSRLYYISLIFYFDTDEIEIMERLAILYTNPVNLGEKEFTLDKKSQLVKRKKLLKLKKIPTFVDYLSNEKMVRIIFNLRNYKNTPLHFVYENIKLICERYGIYLLGGQVIDYIPAEPLLDSGKYYYKGREKEKLDKLKYLTLAINRLRLNTIENFSLDRQVLDFRLKKFLNTHSF